MSKFLVIVESPKKTGYVKKFLGKDFDVIASCGHIADLPSKGLNVDIKNDFAPTYEVYEDKKDIVKNIKDKAKDAEIVYLMSDLDREGEAIAFHISNQIQNHPNIKRAVTGSITSSAVREAIENAGLINMDLVNSYECRRIIDRLAGYKTSYPTKQATGGISAGRVQSAGLRILAEREKEIKSFVPQEYWPIEVTLEKKNGEKVTAQIKSPKSIEISTEKDANFIIDILRKEKWIVSDYENSEKEVRAYAPFTTSSLYQSSSSILGWNSKKTAAVAQSLYEEGAITYIRTDSTFIVPDFINALRTTIPNKYGSSYLPSEINVFGQSKNAQEAHEAIRVTHIEQENFGSGDNQKLYSIIWKRTVASQMEKMKQYVSRADFTCEKYIFGASGSKIIFDGWKKVWDYGSYSDSELPIFKVGEELKLIDVKTEQKFTQPPPRYSEASFIKELEKRGIGRPSTYKTIIDTLQTREYAAIESKTFKVTDMGIRVSDFLVGSNICFVDLDFTANLENDLDRVANKEIDKLCILNKFWDRLKSDLENAKKIKEVDSVTDYDCPKCKKGKLVKKHSKYGAFYTCSKRKDKDVECDYKCNVGEDGSPIEKEKPQEKEYSTFCCKNCGQPLLIRESKKNSDYKYLGCRNWKDKKCQGFYNIDTGEKLEFKKKAFKKWKKKE